MSTYVLIFVEKSADQGRVGEGTWVMLAPMLVLAMLCILFGVLAFRIPLNGLIFPAIAAEGGTVVAGAWWSGVASVLIALSIFIGIVAYWLSMRAGKLRRVGTYVGGEKLEDVYLSNDRAGGQRHVEVTGVDFYQTIERLPLLGRLFVLARAGVFDIYYLFRNGAGYLVQMLRSFHTGILPAYLRWFVAGMLVVVWVVTQSGA